MSEPGTRRGFSWFWFAFFVLLTAGLALAVFSVVQMRTGASSATVVAGSLLVGGALGLAGERLRSARLKLADTRLVREMMDALPNPVFIKDKKGVYRGCNQAFADFLARKREEIVGRSMEELSPRELSEKYKEKDAELLAHPGIQVYDYTVQSRNGLRRNVIFNKATYRNSRGKVAGIIGSIQDITDRKRAEERLRESEEKLRAVLDNIGVGIALIGPEMNVLSVNARMKSWFPAADSGTRPSCYRVFQDPPREEPCPVCPARKALRDGRVHEAVTETAVAGEARNFRVVATAIRDDAGRIAGVIEMVEDITTRKQAEDQIRRLKEFNEDIIETMMDGIVISDSKGIFKFVNPPAAEMLGYTPVELLGQHVDQIVPKDQRALMRRADERRVRGRADRYEIDLLKKNGDRLSVLVSGVPRKEDGRFVGSLGVFTDISERKKLEREVRELSLRDELTLLLNRRGFFEFAPQTFKYAERLKKRLVLLYADLDDFKSANDRFGHQEGDRILVDVGLVIKKTFREYDLVARFGGDEFVVLAMETSRGTPRALRERLEERVGLYNGRTKADRGYRVSLSIGIALWDPEFPAPLEDLIAQADARMYEDKKARTAGVRARKP
jgi:diguanylate cyclase (GGDEF)-like protein/PAS domain S-box-containing protein